jgi:amino acid adenylation domain-containing protein
VSNLPPEQQALQDKCRHPTGTFVAFDKNGTEQSIPEIFEKVVRLFPDRLAVNTKEQTLTYDALNKAANRVARAIRDKRGEQLEPMILLSEHGLGTIVSFLGILKAGKILVAVDPSFPHERAAYMLDGSQAGAILTDNKNHSFAAALAKKGVQIINADALDTSLSDEDLGSELSPEDIAQIIYTSGSTGQPKGVFRNHRRILHDIMLEINAAHICPDDRLIQLRSLSFGAGIKDVLKAMLSGAANFPYDVKTDGLSNLPDFLIRHRITIYISSPSIFRYFVRQLSGKEGFPFLRMIQLGGEPVSNHEVEAYKKHFAQNCLLLHRLSSTETGTLCLYFIGKETELSTVIVPVGYPVEGKEVFLLDENGDAVAPGEVGEIAVKGRSLSSGYWRNPELTGSRFLPDPAGGDKRLYLTGDLGRFLADGCLVHLGRKDYQVKIRGYRFATSEIEMALRGHAQVKDAAVVVWDRDADEKCIVAYVVPLAEPAPSVNELYDFLKKKLPDYMMPSAVIFLESLPFINGKLVRTALPLPDHKRPEMRYPYIPAQNTVQQKLVDIWEQILDIRPIGTHDNFLELGGHSLLATQIVSRVLDAFQVEMSLLSLLESPTIADMAAVITENQSKGGLEDLEHMMSALESLTDQEAERLLARERGENKE